jgi:MFS family permease
MASLALTAAAFTAVLFLLVIELVAGFAVSPGRAAVGVVVLPIAALAAAAIPGPPRAKALAGAVLLAGGLALMAAFALVERKVAAPLAPPRLLRNRSVASANLVSLMANAGFAAAFVVLSLHVQLVLDVGTLATGLVLVPMAASVAVVAGAVSPRLLPLVGARRLVVGGMSLAAIGLVGLGLSIDDGLSWAAVLPGSVAAGTGYGLAFPAWTVVGVERVEAERQGFASGLLTTTQEVGASVGFAIVVMVAAAVAGDGAAVTADSTADGYRWGVVVAGAMIAVGALFALLTPRRVTAEAPQLGGAVAEPVRA